MRKESTIDYIQAVVFMVMLVGSLYLLMVLTYVKPLLWIMWAILGHAFAVYHMRIMRAERLEESKEETSDW